MYGTDRNFYTPLRDNPANEDRAGNRAHMPVRRLCSLLSENDWNPLNISNCETPAERRGVRNN